MKTEMVRSVTTFENLQQQLIDGCRAGDQKSQFKIYKLYRKSMYGTSLMIVNNKAEAEDIIQESFLSAFESIDTYSESVCFGAWLRAIVLSRSMDVIKKANRSVH